MTDSARFIYDLDKLESRIANLQQLSCNLWYACKANPLSHILKTCHKNGLGIDVASHGELKQALKVGYSGSEILSTGPAKSRDYLKAFLAAGVQTYVVESMRQLVELSELVNGQESKISFRPRVLLRIQIAWETEDTSVLGGNAITPFGLSPEDWKREFAELGANKVQAIRDHLDIQGAHGFQWGNILEADHLVRLWKEISKQATSLFQELDFNLKIIDFGGGLGIDYQAQNYHFCDVRELDLAVLNDGLQAIQAEFELNQIWLELGRYLVGPIGRYQAKIVDRKKVRGKNILVLESGVNHLLRPSLTHEAFPISAEIHLSEDDLDLKGSETFEVHGPLCTALDHLGTYKLSNKLSPGDWLEFAQCGAYGFTESMPFFLGHDLPEEIIFHKGKEKCVRKAAPASSWMV